MESYEKKRELLKHCNRKFYPYIDKVLERLPEGVSNKEVLGDPAFRIISFDGESLCGLYIPLGSPIRHLAILNETLLSKPEFEIVHTIAHEIAHKVTGKGRTALHEMEAENLLAKWGFEEESEAVSYHRPILESEGFKIGYEWAKSHDLADFEQFYDDWNEGRLSPKRYEELHYVADVTSILHHMGCLEEPEEILPNHKGEIPEDIMPDDGSLDKGVMGGIMYFLGEKKAKAMTTVGHTGNEKFEFIEQLKRAFVEIGKVFDCKTYSEYCDKLPDLSEAYMQIGDIVDSEEGKG